MGEHREDHADRHGYGGPDQLDLSGYPGGSGDSLWEEVDDGGGDFQVQLITPRNYLLAQAGVDIHLHSTGPAGSITLDADGTDIVATADGTIYLQAVTADVDIQAVAGEVNTTSAQDTNITAGTGLNLIAASAAQVFAESAFTANVDGNQQIYVDPTDMRLEVLGDITLVAGDDVFIGPAVDPIDELEVNAGLIDLNSSGAATLDTGTNLSVNAGTSASFNASTQVAIGSSTSSVTLNANTHILIGGGGAEEVRVNAENAAPGGAQPNGSFVVWFDQTNDVLKFAVKYSTGVTKTGEVPLF